jgi:hypothetical protein
MMKVLRSGCTDAESAGCFIPEMPARLEKILQDQEDNDDASDGGGVDLKDISPLLTRTERKAVQLLQHACSGGV